MKIEMNKETCEINGKEIEYNRFYTKLDLGAPIGVYEFNIKVEGKNDKLLLAQFLEFAEFKLVSKKTQEGNEYIKPVIHVNDGGKVDFEIAPKVFGDSLVLLRLINQI